MNPPRIQPGANGRALAGGGEATRGRAKSPLPPALLNTEGLKIEFAADGIKRLAEIAWQVNEKTENIGARRLHTLLERLLEEVSFSAGDLAGQQNGAPIVIDSAKRDYLAHAGLPEEAFFADSFTSAADKV